MTPRHCRDGKHHQCLVMGAIPPTVSSMDERDARSAGWRPDPAGSGQLRYFDGVGWTNVTRPPDSQFPAFRTAPSATPATPFIVPPGKTPELRLTRRDRFRMLVKPSVTGRRALSRAVGAVLILVSCTTLGFSLWETRVSAWVAQRAQNDLREQFVALQGDAPVWVAQRRVELAQSTPAPTLNAAQSPTGTPTSTLDKEQASGTEEPRFVEPATRRTQEASLPDPVALPPRGELAGRLTIPAIAVDQMILVGTDPGTLADAPGVWEDGVFPGMPGNATISGHRTTYGGPFRHLDQLAYGDQIIFESVFGERAVFEVRGTGVVSPQTIQVTEQGDGVRLTLTTCDPPGSAARRLVIQAELVEGTYQDLAVGEKDWEFRGI